MSGRSLVFWFTGLSGAGKSTICEAAMLRLESQGKKVLVIDGDDVRARLNRQLGFSREDVAKNNRTVMELCDENRGSYDVILVPIISPYRLYRDEARRHLDAGFFEIFCDADLAVVSARDVKGLYAKAKRNEIADMIGVSPEAPYERPLTADLILHTGRDSVERTIEAFLAFVGDCFDNSESPQQSSKRQRERM
jgi:adenylyl-sulfate kinase